MLEFHKTKEKNEILPQDSWKADLAGNLIPWGGMTWDLKLMILRRFGHRVKNLGEMIIEFCI